jgi:hypothetical protein
MSKWVLVFLLAISVCGPALSAERYRQTQRPERHVIELVRPPPYSGSYVINGVPLYGGNGGVCGLERRRAHSPIGGRLAWPLRRCRIL